MSEIKFMTEPKLALRLIGFCQILNNMELFFPVSSHLLKICHGPAGSYDDDEKWKEKP